jgi:hypothetical protein
VVGSEVRAQNHSQTRRGVNGEQPTGTQTAEATSAAEDARAGEAVAMASGRRGTGARGPSGDGGGIPLPAAGAAARAEQGEDGGEEVTGTVIGGTEPRQRDLHFGAPGLHGAGVASEDEWSAAIAIAVAALLVALLGAGWERRREVVL